MKDWHSFVMFAFEMAVSRIMSLRAQSKLLLILEMICFTLRYRDYPSSSRVVHCYQ